MDWFWNVLWFIGLWICSVFVIATFGSQVGIILRCTKKMLARIKNDDEFWDSAACNRYLNKTIAINVIIIIVATAAVVWLVPVVGICGYFIGVVFNLLLNLKSMGINEDNAYESCRIFLRFAKPGMEMEMAELLPMLAKQVVYEKMLMP